jgi:hypothetical protein
MEVKAALDPSNAVLTDWEETTGANDGYCLKWGGAVVCDKEKHVTELNLDQSQLGGVLPQGFVLQKLPKLSWINLKANALTGTLPEDWGALTKLTFIRLDTNHLQGTYPPGWGSMGNLTHLFLYNNTGLTGPVPQEWCSGMPALKSIWSDLRPDWCMPAACANRRVRINVDSKHDPDYQSFICKPGTL